MRILKDFKVPNFKFKKIKMKNIEDIEEVKVDYKKIKEQENKKQEKDIKYIKTSYKTIKEIFDIVRVKYADEPFILEKLNPKAKFQTITYKQFADDVIALRNFFNK